MKTKELSEAKMGEYEINKIIARYLGLELGYVHNEGRGYVEKKFTKSLDALIPAWEKLEENVFIQINRHRMRGYNLACFMDIEGTAQTSSLNKIPIQFLAAKATARAILAKEGR